MGNTVFCDLSLLFFGISVTAQPAVKAALVNNMGIKPERFETDGKGQAKSIADNKAKEGKAQNRRVEFIKL
jgi:outer membrane protein OmpA-like peptidoglycan-associated protein